MAHPFYQLPPGKITFSTQAGYFIEENEYEKAKITQDLFEYDHNYYKLGTAFGVHNNGQIEMLIEAQSNGTLYKKYSPSIGIPVSEVSYQGFHSLEIKFQQFLKTDTEKDSLMFQIKVKGSPLKGKETNNTYQGKDIALSLFWAHKHNQWRVFGEIHSEIIGRKKITQFNGDLETFDTYSQFGSMIGAQWLSDKFWFEGNALFYLTTDFNSRSPTYTRLSDKGFVIGAKALAGRYLTPELIITLEHLRSGSNFNVITESTTEATDYEIEVQHTQLGLTWLF